MQLLWEAVQKAHASLRLVVMRLASALTAAAQLLASVRRTVKKNSIPASQAIFRFSRLYFMPFVLIYAWRRIART